jgi:hypothetical protein
VPIEYASRLSDLVPTGLLPAWLADLVQPVQGITAVLDGLYYTDYALSVSPGGLSFVIDLVIPGEVALGVPGLDSVQLVLGGDGAGATAVTASLRIGQAGWDFRVDDISIALRFPPSVLKPVPASPGADAPPYAQIATRGSLSVDSNLDIRLEGSGLSLAPAMVGDSGVIISADDVKVKLSRTSTLPEITAAGFDESFIGLFIGEAKVMLPEGLPALAPEDLVLRRCAIGSGGVSGVLEAQYSATYDPDHRTFTGRGAGDLFGIPFGLQDKPGAPAVSAVKLEFRQNALTDARLLGQVLLPFFDAPVGVEIGVDLGGGFTVRVDTQDPRGLYTLHRDNLLDLTLDSIGFEVSSGVFAAKLSGQITPLFGRDEGLNWPSFTVKELTIDSKGNVYLAGGWLDLPDHFGLGFHGFQIEITKLGFGKTDDGRKWIGFSGALKLVEGISGGASVDGLRITWSDGPNPDPHITLNGVGVEFEVPDVLRFKGKVSYVAPQPGASEAAVEGQHRFVGSISLALLALDLEVDGTLVFGSAAGAQGPYTYFAIFLGLDLPAGIPLFATGLALYGMAGLFARQYEPDKHVDEQWYSLDHAHSWYHRGQIGVSDLGKWSGREGSMAFGAGITVGTVSDNGFTFSGKTLLVIVFPGPILLIEGTANLLRERPGAAESSEGLFRALAVLDGRAGTFLIGVDAQYKFGSGGELIDLRAGGEAFFRLGDAGAWHLYLGEREPREKRIRARIIQLFEANAYFMLDARQLAMGAWAGYSANWTFGPARVVLESWMEGNVIVSWKPVHYHGDYGLHGKVKVAVFGAGFGLGVDVLLAADVFDPFHLLGKFRLQIGLPWPLPDIKIGITLEWGPRPKFPPLPLPVKEIAVEHLKVTTSWPLARGTLLLPDYDSDGDGFFDGPSGNTQPDDLATVPVIPLDARPRITFGRAVHDRAEVGGNPQPPTPAAERIGDPAKNQGPALVTYSLLGVTLNRWDGQAWQDVASAPSADPSSRLYGSWAPVPAMPDGVGVAVNQVKLWLWSKSPFDYARHTGGAWDEWFTDRFPAYPCVPPATEREACCDFEAIDPAQPLTAPWACPEGFVFSWLGPQTLHVTVLPAPFEKLTHALCIPQELPISQSPTGANIVTIALPRPADEVRLTLVDIGGVRGTGIDVLGRPHGPFRGGYPGYPHLTIIGPDLVQVVLQGKDVTCILQVCAITYPDPGDAAGRDEMAHHLREETARWSGTDNVLVPHTVYRLRVDTLIDAYGDGALAGTHLVQNITEFAYFRTEGPPGITALLPPPGYAHPEKWSSGLDDLTVYVRQTVPATVPPPGVPPPLPRPVYRAYDAGVEFNENYVDLLYRIDRRDLGLYLYDNSNRPVQDSAGRLVALQNQWGQADQLTLTDSETRTIRVFNRSTCAAIQVADIARDKSLTSANVLDPDKVYEGRLVPLLLQEDFSSDVLTGWEVDQDAEGSNDGPSDWEVRGLKGTGATVAGTVVTLDGQPDLSSVVPQIDVLLLAGDANPERPSRRYLIVAVDTAADTVTVDVPPQLQTASSAWRIPGFGAVVQTSNIWGGTADDPVDPVKPGTMLIWAPATALSADSPEQPGNWTDYRLSVSLRSSAQAGAGVYAIGLVVRYLDSGNYYRFSMDRTLGYRRLVRVVAGTHTILAEDDVVYSANRDYTVTIEAIGPSLRVFKDGFPVFAVTDPSFDHGTIGLYCWRNPGARFADVRVDDFRQPGAPVAYRFAFTTSKYVNFFHHFHGFQDEVWPLQLSLDALSNAAFAAQVARAARLESPVTDDESRAYAALAATPAILTKARENPAEVRVTRLQRPADACGMATTLAFLVRSPEPIDWTRTALTVVRADPPLVPVVPGAVKLTGMTFGTGGPNDESVSILLRDAVVLTRQRIEYQYAPGALARPAGDPVWFVDAFDGPNRGELFREGFGLNALDHYTIVPDGVHWSASDRDISQQTGYADGPLRSLAPEKPGTLALTGPASWDNVQISVFLRSEQNADIGVVFRCRDTDTYYRFSMFRHPVRIRRRGPGPFPGPIVVDRLHSYRRLIKRVGGQVTVLWEDPVSYALGQTYEVVIYAYGDRLLGYLDNALLFSVRDPDISTGRVGFYAWGNAGAFFEGLNVRSVDSQPVLWQPAFSDLSDLQIVDSPGATMGPSQWHVAGGALAQTSSIRADDPPGRVDRLGTYALGGDVSWRDAQISAHLRSDEPGEIGVMFRYVDSDNYYRFVIDFQEGRHRLVKRVGGNVTVLREDPAQYQVGQRYEVTILAAGPELSGWVDGRYVFALEESDLGRGKVGLYCRGNPGAVFERLVVTDAARRVGPWIIHDDEPFAIVPSAWKLSGGALRQTHEIITHAVAGDVTWTDYRVAVRLRSDAPAGIGILFRYVDEDHYYRFSLDASLGIRQLEVIAGGVATTLWSAPGTYTVGEPFTLTVDAVGSHLVGYVNDTRLWDVSDGSHVAGQVGLFCFENWGARFERVEVRRPPVESYALLRDRFADGDTAGWTVVDAGTIGASSWTTIADGWLQQTGDIDSPALGDGAVSRLGTQQIAGDPTWADVIASARLRSSDGDPIGLLFRYVDADHYYRFSIDRITGYRRLVKNSGGTFSVLWEDSIAYQLDRPYEIAIVAQRSTLRGFIDGIATFVVWDDEIAAGSIGLYCAGNRDARFAQVRVYPGDRGFTGWLFDEPFAFGALVGGRWSFVGDPQRSHWEWWGGRLYGASDGSGGQDSPGTYALGGAATWSDYRVSIQLANIPLGLAVLAGGGGMRGLVRRAGAVGRAGPGTDAGARSPLARAGDVIATWLRSTVSHVERFLSVWTSALSSEPATPSSAPAPQRQREIGGPAEASMPGSAPRPDDTAVSSDTAKRPRSERPPSEVPPLEHVIARIHDRAREGAGGSSLDPGRGVREVDDNGIVGVLVRYVDEGHYYLFSMERRDGRRRLIKRLAETVCVLWEDNAQYEVGRDYIVTVDCVGARLTGYLDGIRLFDVADVDFPAGRIGLYCGPASADSFREVRVAAPAWVNFYDFGTEARRPAGSRVRIFSGNANDAPPEDPGIEDRFTASLGDAGEVRLPGDRADLRVAGPGAATGHARAFLPDTDYADFILVGIDIAVPLDLRVLRNADGTGFFLVKAAAAPIPPGQYRLNLMYRRDNRAVDSNSQVLREAGSSDPEEVKIDIPTVAISVRGYP